MLPVFRRFSIADIPGSPEWLNNVLGPLNTFCEQTVQTLNKNLTVGANIQGSKYSTTFSTTAGYAGGDFTPIVYQYNGGGQPSCLLIGQISESTGATILTPVTITSWTPNINVSPILINVNYIAGLTASKKYTITLLAL